MLATPTLPLGFALVVPLATALSATGSIASPARILPSPLRRAASRCAALGPDDEGGAMLPAAEMDALRARIAKIARQGGELATPAQKLFEIATEKQPGVLMAEFFSEAPLMVAEAMQDAIASLLGTLPALQFDSEVSTTGDRLASLLLQLQMTGYMLRNAQYVLSLRKLLGISGKTYEEFKAAFESVDTDGSGFLEVGEVKEMLTKAYGSEPPAFETVSFMNLFDTNNDGRVSWDEFLEALGGDPSGTGESAAFAALPAEGNLSSMIELEGSVTVTLENGREIEVDAAEYLKELQGEAARLRAELLSLEQEKEAEALAVTLSLSSYVSSLPKDQLKVLTQGISEDVVTAMNMVVKFILKAPGPDGPREMTGKESLKIEEARLQQLCLYQLVLGYRLREAEAKGEARRRLGQ